MNLTITRSEFNFFSFPGTVQSVDIPFKLYRIRNVFSDRKYVKNLKEELEKLEFSHNANDMFSLHQTMNLTHLKKSVKFPMVGKFLQFLENFKDILSQEMKIDFEPEMSVSSSKYCYEGRFDIRT